jgi:NitT/TauT family transport system ATP-binding protein
VAAPALEVIGLRKSYARDGRTLEVLDLGRLSVADGEFVTVVGPSGCGKSTLLHILGGFIPAEAGAIRVHGRAVVGPGPDRGMVFQEFSLFPWRTVSGNVGWGLEVRGATTAERQAVVDRYLELTGLAEFRDHLPGELSGGMKQRVALARVLAFDPEVLLMDEPFGSLDAQTRETMQEELIRIWERTGKTIFFVTHDIDEAVYLGDRVLVLSARPARVREEVAVALPRPRGVVARKSTAFLECRNHILDLIREEKAL